MDKIETYYDVMAEMWFAYIDREEGTEEVPHGFGKTEAEAIDDLHDKLVMGG